MNLLALLAVVAVAQVVFIILLTAFVVTRRERLARRSVRIAAGRARVAAPMAQWLAGTDTLQRVRESLCALPHDAALAFAALLHDTRVPLPMRAKFGTTLRDEPWAAWALAGATSWRWWRRLDAARALGIVGNTFDAALLHPLLGDPHPAVRLAATQALAAVADPELIRVAVLRYPAEPLAVRLYTTHTLRIVWQLAEKPLRDRLTSDSADRDLASWLALAESLNLPSLRRTVTALAAHLNPEVRAAAARALRRYPHAESVDAVRALLGDPQDYVRAAAAQALGALRATDAEPQLERALGDPAWSVRFRSALALAQIGESGRAVLRRARQSSDRFARDMATMTSGLPDGAVLELAEA